MTLKTRRYLYSFFILIFIIVTPIISLYATGYKIGPNFSLQKTGALIIDTKPRGAKIFLNNKLQYAVFANPLTPEKNYLQTPIKIKNLLPGEYDIRLELEGFLPWQKKLVVKPNESTYIETVNLFKNNLPLLLVPGTFSELSPSPDNNYLLARGANKISLIDLENETEIFSSSTAANIKYPATAEYSWADDSRHVFIHNSILNINDLSTTTALEKIIGAKFYNLKWFSGNANKFYYLDNNGLSAFDLALGLSEPITTSTQIMDYLPGAGLYYLTSTADGVRFGIFNNEAKTNAIKITLPQSVYQFYNLGTKTTSVYDTQKSKLYLLNPDAPLKPVQKVINNLTRAYWLKENVLLYANEFEIWLANTADGSEKLITRISEPIQNIIPHPDANNILYNTGNSINAIELDDRDKYNIIKLVQLEKIQGLYLNPDGDTLYFYAKINNMEGIYKLNIQ